MRYLRYGFLAVLGIVLVTIALANTAPVTLRLITDDMAGWLGITSSVQLPLFIVIFGGIIGGVLIGFVWEWFREHKQRAEATRTRRDKERLEREVSRLKEKDAETMDSVLALLEK